MFKAMTLHWKDGEPLPEPFMIQFPYTYMHTQALMW